MTPPTGPPATGTFRRPVLGTPDARQRRQFAATAWRNANITNPNREQLWRAYRKGCLWEARLDRALTRDLKAALRSAELAVPFAAP